MALFTFYHSFGYWDNRFGFFMKIKHLPFVAGMASLALILGAYSFEHIGGLYPCKLCLWQRYPHFLNILLIFFLIIGIIIIYNFRGHNQNKAIEACIAGSKKLDTPMTVEEAKEFCKQKIQNKQ